MTDNEIKVHRTRVFGNIDTRRIFPGTYEDTRVEFITKYGINLPKSSELKLDNKSEWRVLLSPLTIYLFTNKGIYGYDFKMGFITDFASIPKIFRGALMDNDDLDVLYASLVHDANFAHKLLGADDQGFHRANCIFRQMVKIESHHKFKAFMMYLGVSSPIGKKRYKTYSPKDKYRRVKLSIL